MATPVEPLPLRLPRWLPARLRAAAAARPVVARLLENASWLAGERVAVLALAFFFNAWFVRALGPAEYGRYSWAVSFAGLFGAIATLAAEDGDDFLGRLCLQLDQRLHRVEARMRRKDDVVTAEER